MHRITAEQVARLSSCDAMFGLNKGVVATVLHLRSSGKEIGSRSDMPCMDATQLIAVAVAGAAFVSWDRVGSSKISDS